MFNKYIHNVFVTENRTEVNDDAINHLLNATQFTSLGRISESSSYLLYHFRQENDLSKENFVEKDETTHIVFVDDFSITGSQACDYITEYKADKKWSNDEKVYVLLMIATNEAIIELKKLEGITILPCIVMDDKSKVFSDESIAFEGYKSKYKELAKTMCMFYGEKLSQGLKDMTPFGYAGGGYMFGAYYNIPDNTLPIFWSNKNNWNYLFKRYNKKYSGGINFGGRYV
jgi:hypothetical protein